MGIKINFDTSGNIEYLNLVLAHRNGDKISPLKNIHNLSFTNSMGNPSEFSFRVYKSQYSHWNDIKDFRLVWVQEWDRWFQIRVELNESNSTSKFVTATHLPEAELSNLKLYGTEINTEDDINRTDYKERTVFFNDKSPENSLLHRITTKAVNFVFNHIDESLCNIKKVLTFSFDDEYIYDALKAIEEEVHCIFEFSSCTDENGHIVRKISAYDLESYCNDCGYRGEFSGRCPECDSENVEYGYGTDTTIFLSTENALDEVDYSVNTDSVKNCFKLVGGDDLMTAAIVSCNPNGSSYIWHNSEDQKEEMSLALVKKIDEYDERYDYYNQTCPFVLDVDKYNELIEKYQKYNDSLIPVSSPIVGYANLINLYFDVIDMQLFLESGLMPSSETIDTSAEEQGENLIKEIKTVGVNTLKNLTKTTVESSIKAMAKSIIDYRYQVKLGDNSSLSNNVWTGNYVITNYSDEEDTFTTANTNITVTEDYETFVKQKVEKVLAKGDDDNYSITGLFEYDENTFEEKIKEYGLSSLKIFADSCQSAIDILIEQGCGDASQKSDLYNSLYVPYLNKLNMLQQEIDVREKEIEVIDNLLDVIENTRNNVNKELDFEKFLGEDLWKEFSLFRMEDTYSNSNYVSDNLSNSELFENAKDFLKTATKELIKSATLQHTISAKLKNIFTIQAFEPIRDYFEIGNWLRIGVDDKVYKLRMIEYTIDFDDYKNSDVTFSDVEVANNDITDIQSVINNARSISSSYSYISRQANKGSETYNVVSGWTKDGLDATLTKIVNNADSQDIVYDSHGLLFRRMNDITGTYDDEQLKIINTTIAFTTDNWRTVKTAIGHCYFIDPDTGKAFDAYGVNAEVLCGRIIIGEELKLSNKNNKLRFDENGLTVENDTNKVIINPDSDKLFNILKGNDDLLYVDNNGNLNLTGNVTATNLTATISGKIGPWNFNSSSIWKGNSSFGISGNGNMYFGDLGLSISDKFKVDSNGNAQITGDIQATSLTINNTISMKNTALGSTYVVMTYGDDGVLYMGGDSTFETVQFFRNVIVGGTCGAAFLEADQGIYCNNGNIQCASGEIIACKCPNYGGQFRAIHGDYGFIIRNDGSNSYFLLTNSGDAFGSWNSLRPLFINNSTGTVYCENGIKGHLIHNSYGVRLGAGFSNASAVAFNPCDSSGASASDGNIYLGGAGARWHTVFAVNGCKTSSDVRDKNIESDIDNRYIELFQKLRPVIYKWKNSDYGDRAHVGLIAQEVEQAANECGLSYDDLAALSHDYFDKNQDGRTDRYSLSYEEFSVINILVTQKLLTEFDLLKKRIEKLESRAS